MRYHRLFPFVLSVCFLAFLNQAKAGYSEAPYVYDISKHPLVVKDEKSGVMTLDPWLVKSPLTGPSVSAIPGSDPSIWTIVKTWVKGRFEFPSLNQMGRPDLPRTASITTSDSPVGYVK